MMLDNPDDGTEDDAGLEQKLRAEAERMTQAQPNGPPARSDADDSAPEPEPEITPADAAQTPQEPPKHRVKLPGGEEEEVSLDELLNGYSRQADYTRKMQALSEERRQAVEGPRSQYEQLNNQLIQRLQAFMPEKPDVAMLNPQSEKYNPDGYHLQRANYEAFQEHLIHAQGEQKRLEGERQKEQQAQASERLQAEGQRIFKAIPEWKDPKTMEADTQKMRGLLHKFGLGDQDINAWVGSETFNHVQVAVLRLAAQAATALDQKAIAEAKVKDVPPVVKPGAAEVKDTDSDEVRRLRAQVKKNPRDDRLVASLWAAQDKQNRARANRR
jgi:hypothetical protein